MIINAHNFPSGDVDLLTGLQWYWDLNTAGATETDQHNGLVLSKSGTVNVSSGGAPDGADCIDVGSAAGYYRNASVARTIDTEAGFSVNIWGYSTADSATANCIFNHRGSSASQTHWQINIRDSSSTDRAITRDAVPVVRTASASEASANAWHMYTLVDDATSLRLYVDGSLVATDATALGTRDSAAREMAIGAAAWSAGSAALRHNGRISMAGVWGIALDTTQISALYNSGAGKRYAAL